MITCPAMPNAGRPCSTAAVISHALARSSKYLARRSRPTSEPATTAINAGKVRLRTHPGSARTHHGWKLCRPVTATTHTYAAPSTASSRRRHRVPASTRSRVVTTTAFS
jgi:hypothetical protein